MINFSIFSRIKTKNGPIVIVDVVSLRFHVNRNHHCGTRKYVSRNKSMRLVSRPIERFEHVPERSRGVAPLLCFPASRRLRMVRCPRSWQPSFPFTIHHKRSTKALLAKRAAARSLPLPSRGEKWILPSGEVGRSSRGESVKDTLDHLSSSLYRLLSPS